MAAKKTPLKLNSEYEDVLTKILFQEGYVNSPAGDESAAIISSIVDECEEYGSFESDAASTSTTRESLLAALQSILDLSKEVGTAIIGKCERLLATVETSQEERDGDDEVVLRDEDSAIGDEDDGAEYIGEGECELCERSILLTRHHLIPKCTWARLEPRLVDALQSFVAASAQAHYRDEGEAIEKAQIRAGSEQLFKVLQQEYRNTVATMKALSLGDKEAITNSVATIPSRSTGSEDVDLKLIVKYMLGRTCLICRPCHSAVHRSHSNMELAYEYNTVSRLLEDESIVKFAKWAHKQKTGRYTKCPKARTIKNPNK